MRRLSLTQVLAVAAAAVAATALLCAALLTTPLVRGATEDAARTALARQAELLARLPGPRVADQLQVRADERPMVRGVAVGVVTADGRPYGAALALGPDDRDAAAGGASVSVETAWLDQRVFVEARPLRAGGAVVLAAGAGDVDRAVTAQRRRMLLALGVGLVAALVAGGLVARQLGRPLAALAETARRMGAGERGAVPPDSASGGTREVGEVADALRHLDAALRQSEDRQRRFLTSVSHELRTPLTAVRGYAESMTDGAVGPDELPALGAILVAESQRLERYIGDLLALARLEADDFPLERDTVDLVALVVAAGEVWRDRAARSEVTVVVEAPAGRIDVRTDAGRVRQVVDALADNAVRVCPPGARVVLAVAGTPTAGGTIEVRDSGPGLIADDRTVAFEPGVLHDRYADTRPGGHGLGLALAHRLVTRLGGTVRVGPAPEGGAAFTVDLP